MKLKFAAISILLACSSAVLQAGTLVLTFEGLQDLESVNNFYNDGFGSLGSSGYNFGISFSNQSLAVIDYSLTGSGDTQNEPTSPTSLIFLSGVGDIMNMPEGFVTSFSFFYSAPFLDGSVQVFDGVDGTGNVLATISLPTTAQAGPGCDGFDFCPFVYTGVLFDGVARSVNFGGTADQIAFDNITLDNVNPEPSTFLLLVSGVLAAAAFGQSKKAALKLQPASSHAGPQPARTGCPEDGCSADA